MDGGGGGEGAGACRASSGSGDGLFVRRRALMRAHSCFTGFAFSV